MHVRRVTFEVELHAMHVRAVEISEVIDREATRVPRVRQLGPIRAALLPEPQLGTDPAVARLHDCSIGARYRWSTFDTRAGDLTARRPRSVARSPCGVETARVGIV